MSVTCMNIACITAPCPSICTNQAGQLVNQNGSPVIGLAPGATATVQPGIFGGTQASLPPELRGNKPNERGNNAETIQEIDKGMSVSAMVAIAAAISLVLYILFKSE